MIPWHFFLLLLVACAFTVVSLARFGIRSLCSLRADYQEVLGLVMDDREKAHLTVAAYRDYLAKIHPRHLGRAEQHAKRTIHDRMN